MGQPQPLTTFHNRSTQGLRCTDVHDSRCPGRIAGANEKREKPGKSFGVRGLEELNSLFNKLEKTLTSNPCRPATPLAHHLLGIAELPMCAQGVYRIYGAAHRHSPTGWNAARGASRGDNGGGQPHRSLRVALRTEKMSSPEKRRCMTLPSALIHFGGKCWFSPGPTSQVGV